MKILGIGDFARETGFARVNQEIFTRLTDRFDIVWLGWNYHGDPHPVIHTIKTYSPTAKDVVDFYGHGRVNELITKEKPDLIFVHGDPWTCIDFIPLLQPHNLPCVFYSPVDSEQLAKKMVYPLSFYVGGMTYCQWSSDELYKRGLPSFVPVFPTMLGASDDFYPITDKLSLRLSMGMSEEMARKFIVLAVDRNSSRKNIPDIIQCLRFWMDDKDIDTNDILFWYHGSLKDEGADLEKVAADFNVNLALTSKNLTAGTGVPIDILNKVYNVADVRVSLSGAEGFSLPTLEAMRTQLPNIVLNHSAIPSWAEDGVVYVQPQRLRQYQYSNYPTVPQARVDVTDFVEKIDLVYRNPVYRKEVGKKGWEVAQQDKFQWDFIAKDVGDYLLFLNEEFILQDLQKGGLQNEAD